MRQPRSKGLFFSLLLSVLLPLAATLPALPVQADAYSLQSAFTAAANEFGVPVSILLAVSYNESRWEDHHGQPSFAGGYGVMHLTDVPGGVLPDNKGTGVEKTHYFDSTDPNLHTLQTAATLLGVNPDVLKTDVTQNIRGGAALLAKYADDTVGARPENEADWYGAAAKYSGSSEAAVALGFADEVFATIERGESRVTSDGQRVTLEPRHIVPHKATVAALGLHSTPQTGNAECPEDLSCQFIPAYYGHKKPEDYGNYDLANRPADGLDIRYIVIHDTETPYQEAIDIFQNPASYASAHYVIRSSDGQITQMVPTKDIAWQAGNWYMNMHSIGIEHEGYAIEGATWYTESLYRASAKLVRYLAEKYDIPLDRAHILGHDGVPGLTPQTQTGMHWDPGTYWDWDHYMDLLSATITAPNDSGHNSSIVTIKPNFETNQPPVSYCDASGCRDLPKQPTNFVYLYTAPSFSAPLIADAALSNTTLETDGHGTTLANDWGDKAVTGQSFYLADKSGNWDAIYYSGQKAWFYNPRRNPTAIPGGGAVVAPKPGKTSIPVYGGAYPEASAYPPSITSCSSFAPLQYSIPAGQKYVVADPSTDLLTSDYYWACTFTLNPSDHVLVTGQTKFYQIFFNHREAFVKADDVDLVPGAGWGPK